MMAGPANYDVGIVGLGYVGLTLATVLAEAGNTVIGVEKRADLVEMDKSLQAELTGKGMVFAKPDPAQFKAALVKAGFYAQWQKTYGAEAWAELEKYTGPLT